MNDCETLADIVAIRRRMADQIEDYANGKPNQFQRELIADLRAEADRIEAAWRRENEYPKAQSLDADKLTGKNLSGLVTDLRQIAKYHYARGNIDQGQFARVMADRIEAIAIRAYNEIDSAVCAIEYASSADIDDVRKVMENTIGDYFE